METSETSKLKELVAAKGALDIDRLKEFLEFLQEIKEKCREEIENEEGGSARLAEFELKKTELEHAERMRALELGQAIPDRGDIGKAHSAIWAAALIGLLVPLALVGAGITTTVLVLRTGGEGSMRIFDLVLDRQVVLIALVWKVGGLLSLITIWLSLRTIRKARESTAAVVRPTASQTTAGA